MRLLYLTSAWVGGLLWGLLLSPPIWPSLIFLFTLLAIGLIGLAIRRYSAGSWKEMLGRKSLRIFAAILLASIYLLGVVRSVSTESLLPPDPGELPDRVRINGIVTTQPESTGNSLRFVLRTVSIDADEGLNELVTDILVTARPTPELVSLRQDPFIRYGDRLTLEGNLTTPPILETFDYRDYLARQGIHLVMDFPTVQLREEGLGSPALTAIYNFRDAMTRSLSRALPEPRQS